MRIGIFGGTFDPVHLGHLLLAECCREQVPLDAVWFLPAAVPPHKQQRELTPAKERIEMLELAVGGYPAFSICRYETDRGGVNYTADTLAQFRDQEPAGELFLFARGRHAPRSAALAAAGANLRIGAAGCRPPPG